MGWMAVCAIFAIAALVSCDIEYDVDAYFKNTTDRTVVLVQTDSTRIDFPYKRDTLIIGPGEVRMVYHEYFLNMSPSTKDVPFFLEEHYPYGLQLVFQNGKTIAFSPDSAMTQPHSPFAEKSYRFEIIPCKPFNGHDIEAYYEIVE